MLCASGDDEPKSDDAAQHPLFPDRPGRRVEIQEALPVHVGVGVHARLVRGGKNALHDLVIAELIAKVLGEQSDPARDERGRGRGAGLFKLDETLRCARLAVGSRRGTRDVHARRGQTELLRDPAAVGKIGDRALRIRCHDGQRMTP